MKYITTKQSYPTQGVTEVNRKSYSDKRKREKQKLKDRSQAHK